jgi:NAD(P)H-hydrate repair Nnr-like enzyme with NAD(P)H-hydrate dehydratase domain
MQQHYLTQHNEPLFPKVLWNRPINRATAGRLLLVGGHSHDFVKVQEIYQLANACGVGRCVIVMPDSLRILLSHVEDTYFVPASPSGSMGKGAIAEIVRLAEESDGLSVGANLSNNSETAVAVERLLTESTKPRVIYLDALEVASFNPKLITDRNNCCIIVTMQGLFKLAGKLGVALNIQPERGLLGRVELIQSVAEAMKSSLICIGKEIIIVSDRQTSVTPETSAHLNSAVYATMSVFWTQKPDFEHLTAAAFIIQQLSKTFANQDTISTTQTVKEIEKVLMNF